MKNIEYDLTGLSLNEKIRFLDKLQGDVKYTSHESRWNSVFYAEIINAWLVSERIVKNPNNSIKRGYWANDFNLSINDHQFNSIKKQERNSAKYTDNPRLNNDEDLYYEGAGPTWDTDLDGNRYHKRHSGMFNKNSRYNHLDHGDIVDEKARIRKIIEEYLTEMDI